MSNSAINWMVKLSIEPTAKHVLMVMANRAVDGELLYTGKIKDLADETSREKSTIIRALRYLQETSLITLVQGDDARCNTYRVNVNTEPKAYKPEPRIGSTELPNKKVAESNRLQRATYLGSREQPKKVAECYTPPHTPPNREYQKKPKKTNSAQSADPRHSEFVKWLYGEHPKITILPQHFKALKTLLEASPHMTLDDLREYWATFRASPLPFHRQQGLNLGFFCNQISSFTRDDTNERHHPAKPQLSDKTQRILERQRRIAERLSDTDPNRAESGDGRASDGFIPQGPKRLDAAGTH